MILDSVKTLLGNVFGGDDAMPGEQRVTAEVLNTDAEGTTWVHVFGGVERTPLTQANIDVEPGDVVNVLLGDGYAILDQNVSAPLATGRTVVRGIRPVEEKADTAQETADDAARSATTAKEAADSAIKDAKTAAEAAEEAGKSAANAAEAAGEAQEAADDAKQKAQDAWDYADDAAKASNAAQTSADEASIAAINAQDSANDAGRSAQGALNGLSTVQGVIGVLSGHADDMDSYISTHLALTDAGLHVVPTEQGYFIVLGTDGMHVYSPDMVEVARYGDGYTVGELGKMHMVASGNRLSFIDGSGAEVAYIAIADNGESTFFMNKAIVNDELKFSSWKWYRRASGNMSLKWTGATA